MARNGLSVHLAAITLLLALSLHARAQEPIELGPGGNGPIVVVTQTAPIFLLPDASRQPLRTAQQGSHLTLVENARDWIGVRFQDPQFGIRTGYMQARFGQIETPAAPMPPAAPAAPSSEDTPAPEPRTMSAPTNVVASAQANVVQTDTSEPIAVGVYGMVGGGGVKDDEHDGGRLTLGGALRIGPLVLEFNPLDLAISPGDTYPYYRDTFSNGQSRCRNGSNGQFASDESCIAFDVSYFKSFGAGIVVPRSPVFVGFGRRFNDAANPWFGSGGVMAFFNEDRFFGFARVEVGKSYIGGLAAFGIRLAGN